MEVDWLKPSDSLLIIKFDRFLFYFTYSSSFDMVSGIHPSGLYILISLIVFKIVLKNYFWDKCFLFLSNYTVCYSGFYGWNS